MLQTDIQTDISPSAGPQLPRTGWRCRCYIKRRGDSSSGLADSPNPVRLKYGDACLQARISLGVRLAQLRKKAGITSDMTAEEVEAALKHAKADTEAEAEAERLQKERAAEEVGLLNFPVIWSVTIHETQSMMLRLRQRWHQYLLP